VLCYGPHSMGPKGYSGFLAGSQKVVLPRVRSDANWWTGIRVMNVDGNGPTGVTINFYHANGASAGALTRSIDAGYGSLNLGDYVRANFSGSAVVTADRPIAISVIMTLSGNSQQTMMYNGNNR
jgi:hypothetical protein